MGRIYRTLKNLAKRWRYRGLSHREIFSDVYGGSRFGGSRSASGPGSDADQTRALMRAIPTLLRDLTIASMLDIPCGDFYWMRRVDLGTTHYIGADVVADLVAENRTRYARNNVTFLELDLLHDTLPHVDLILCRDCLVHFSNADVVAALANVSRSKATYFATTTFAARPVNAETFTGDWRPLNLTAPPFALPTPELLINEHNSEQTGAYRDKSLGVWHVSSIRRSI